MAFGFGPAPAHFQYVMNSLLDAPPLRPDHATYLDDCTVGGSTVQEAWENTLVAMKKLTDAGLPLNIKKCQLLRREVVMLGVFLSSGKY